MTRSRGGDSRFAPVAIVGRGCVLPGARSPERLWEVVLRGEDLLTSAPEGAWGIAPDRVTIDAAGRRWSDRGGYVEPIELDPDGLAVPPELVGGLDPSLLWVIEAGRAALREAGHTSSAGAARAALVLGNLSLPTVSLSRYAESVWLEGLTRGVRPDPRVRFMSGLPATLAARALRLAGGAFALDAACASSLYAIRLACDALQRGRADLVLAGAVNGTDPLFLHAGFRALAALSPTGRSRPFHGAADGLVPAQGVALVALKRLEDAETAGDRILGVIRGVGLSNDGGRAGLLVPLPAGQERAMRDAYRMAGLEPEDVSLIECHATGTPVGDSAEVESTGALYRALDGVPIGSLKSNLGHTLTASGAAGLLKVLSAMDAAVRPPMRLDGPTVEALARSPFRLLTEAEPWRVASRRVAAVSSFGFGGNNAHLLVEQWEPSGPARASRVARRAAERPTERRADGGPRGARELSPPVAVAVVGVGIVAAGSPDMDAFARRLLWGEPPTSEPDDGSMGAAPDVTLEVRGLRFPPRDLAEALPQQVLLLRAAMEAAGQASALPADRTGVYVGMQCDAEIARHMARVRIDEWAPAWANRDGAVLTGEWLSDAKAAFATPLTAAAVLGTLPNVVANRVNAQLGLAGASCAVSAEELSGIAALDVALAALDRGDLDAALVGAVDLCREPVHEAAARALFGDERRRAGDAAVVLVLKRWADARRDGDRVYALVSRSSPICGSAAASGAPDESPRVALRLSGEPEVELASRFGHAHAASGLLHVAAAALCCGGRAGPASPGPRPWTSGGARWTAFVQVRALGGASASVRVREAPGTPVARGRTPAERGSGLATEPAARTGSLAVAQGPGRVALVFAGAGAAYRGMGAELLVAMPELTDRCARRFPGAAEASSWAWDAQGRGREATPFEKLAGSSFLCQAHAELSLRELGLVPSAVLGFSSGETNGVVAIGAWGDMDDLLTDLRASGLYSRELGGEHRVLRRLWGEATAEWTSWCVRVPVDEVRQALAGESRVYLTAVHAPSECAIGGDPAACRRVLARLGARAALPIDYDFAAHSPAVSEVRETWRALHRRPTNAVPGVRLYTSGGPGAYDASTDAVADALTGMAMHAVDFPSMVERAWQDGVRVFVEHGPGDLCTRWIRQILKGREHLAVAFDRRGVPGDRQASDAAAALAAAGVAVDPERVRPPRPKTASAESGVPRIAFPAHPPRVALPPLRDPGPQRVPRAPVLPPVAAEASPERVEAGAPGGAGLPAFAQPAAPGGDPRAVSFATAASGATAAFGAPARPLQAGPLDAWIRLRSEHLAALSAAHRAFLDRQSRVQREFLLARGPLVRGLHDVLRGAPRAPEPPGVARAAADGTSAWTRAPSGLPVLSGGGDDATETRPGEANGARKEPPSAASGEADATRPRWGRAELERLASGRISDLFGPRFREQDGFRRQVRMPMPPLLLADRVVRIEGEPASHGTGSIVTETDVTRDSWYLHDGRMPPGIQVEAGQADLLLCSWLGADLLNRGERVYRLLGCELTFHGARPRAGETLRYEIHLDGYARSGDVRLFFFHSDCTVDGERRLSVRGGQAGFFSDEELRDSGGVVWDAATAAAEPPPSRAEAPGPAQGRSFGAERLRAFSEGRAFDCFGPGFEGAAPHVRSPSVQRGDMLFLDEVSSFEPEGGPWKGGYLRARTRIRPDQWFFPGHFKDDPTMPGTLMFEAGLQAMAFHMAALGFTRERDGWVFEPVPDVPYRMLCRGQVTPASRELVTEIFVHGVEDGPTPTLWADVLMSVDGLKAFHCRRMGLRLVPGWPLEADTVAAAAPVDVRAAEVDGFRFDHASLLHCARGRPTLAFGPGYRAFDGARSLPRLPGPPYHFMTRVTRVTGEMGRAQAGASVEVEYEVPPDAWYFRENGAPTMPLCVLMEAALQPCGWLTAFMGVPLASPTDLSFRNLDGSGTLLAEVGPNAGVLRTTSTCTGVSRSRDTWIESFDVSCRVGEAEVFRMSTTFGHFPRAAMAQQAGLPFTEEERSALLGGRQDASEDVPPEGAPRLPHGKLEILDRVSGAWPDGGRRGKGRLVAEIDVDPGAWFFSAHFFQDPVQPGSLGVEAMVRLLQHHMLRRGVGESEGVRFEPLAVGRTVTWKYRGQVVPTNRRVHVELEITDEGRDARGAYAVAEAWLWVDGKRIYHVKDLGMRVVRDDAAKVRSLSAPTTLDPGVDRWLLDHRPTYTVPVVPLAVMADSLAAAVHAHAPGLRVVALEEARALRWLACDGPTRLRTRVAPVPGDGRAFDAALEAWRDASDPALSRFEPVATARVRVAAVYAPAPGALAPLADARPVPDPYASGALIHGPAFQVLESLALGSAGSSAVLDAGRGGVPRGLLSPVLLDAITHAIPNAELAAWCPELGTDHVAYPVRIERASFHADAPAQGAVALEVRFDGLERGDPGGAPLPRFRAQLAADGRLWADVMLVARLFPKGPIGRLNPLERRAFLRDRAAVTGAGLSRADNGVTRLAYDDVARSDWLPGTLSRVYRASEGHAELARVVAAKEHVARSAHLHPSAVELSPTREGFRATYAARPMTSYDLDVRQGDLEVVVQDRTPPALDVSAARDYWARRLGVSRWPVEDLYFSLADKFVRSVVLEAPEDFAKLRGRSVLYVANHQVALESFLFTLLTPGLTGVPNVTLAKNEVRTRWLDEFLTLAEAYPGVALPSFIVYLDQQDPQQVLRVFAECREQMVREGLSALVHVEGTRSLTCRRPVEVVSSSLLDMAIGAGAPVVPVRFVGGLPVAPLEKRLHVPVGHGSQDYWFGRAIPAETLASLPYAERRRVVLDALNALGPGWQVEEPNAPDPVFEKSVEAWMAGAGAGEEYSILWRAVQSMREPGDWTRRVRAAAAAGELAVDATPVGRWTAEMARRLFGPGGPRVVERQ